MPPLPALPAPPPPVPPPRKPRPPRPAELPFIPNGRWRLSSGHPIHPGPAITRKLFYPRTARNFRANPGARFCGRVGLLTWLMDGITDAYVIDLAAKCQIVYVPGIAGWRAPDGRWSAPMSALDGVRVLDLTHQVAGPSATLVLAFLGADVVKVIAPGSRDSFDAIPFYLNNASKRSVELDLKSADGLGRAKDLARHADVFVENFSPGVID